MPGSYNILVMYVTKECVVEVPKDMAADHDDAIDKALQEVKKRLREGETVFTDVPSTVFAVHKDDMIVTEGRRKGT